MTNERIPLSAPYDSATVGELKTECKARGIVGYSAMRKSVLIKALNANDAFGADFEAEARTGGEKRGPHLGQSLVDLHMATLERMDNMRVGIDHNPHTALPAPPPEVVKDAELALASAKHVPWAKRVHGRSNTNASTRRRARRILARAEKIGIA